MPAAAQIRELERGSIVCPLGLRFWDTAAAAFVTDGLSVSAYPVGQPGLRRSASPASSGAWAFHRLPGLRAAEQGAGDAEFWAAPPVQREFQVEVVDGADRFLPVSLRVWAPHRGFVSLADLSSPALDGPLDALPLYSAPHRVTPALSATVRAQAWDVALDAPAAGLVLEVLAQTPTGTVTARGLADARGAVAVFFPYPELPPPPPSAGSPPAAGRSLLAQTWTLAVRARYAPAADPAAVPDLAATLAQPEAELLSTLSPPVPWAEAELRYGEELILRSAATPAAASASVLYVQPAAPPP